MLTTFCNALKHISISLIVEMCIQQKKTINLRQDTGGDTGASMIRDPTAAIIRDGKVPSEWEQFHCLPLQW